WPLSVRISWPLALSHSPTVRSSPALAMAALEVGVLRRGVQVPQLDNPVFTRDQRFPVRTPRQRSDGGGRLEDGTGLAAGHIPQLDHLIPTGRGQRFAARTPG